MFARRRRPRERNALDSRISDKHVTDVAAAAGDKIEDAAGQARLLKNLDQLGGDDRRVRGGLEYDRVARHHRWEDLPRRVRHREVPGGDAGDHAQRDSFGHAPLVAKLRGYGFPMRVASETGGILGHVDRLLDVSPRLLEDFAHLLRHQAGQLFLPLLDDQPRLETDLAASWRRGMPPTWKGFLGRLDGGVHVLASGGLHHAQHLVLVGRVGRGEGSSALRFHPAAADVVLVGLRVRSLASLAGHRLAHAATSSNAPFKISHPSSSSACERFSGGTSRSTLSCAPQLSTTRPESRQTCRIFVCSFLSGTPSLPTSSTPTIRPRPRTSPIAGVRCCRSRSRRISSAPFSVALASTCSRSKTSSVAIPAAHETGLPPKVEPCAAGSH